MFSSVRRQTGPSEFLRKDSATHFSNGSSCVSAAAGHQALRCSFHGAIQAESFQRSVWTKCLKMAYPLNALSVQVTRTDTRDCKTMRRNLRSSTHQGHLLPRTSIRQRSPPRMRSAGPHLSSDLRWPTTRSNFRSSSPQRNLLLATSIRERSASKGEHPVQRRQTRRRPAKRTSA